MRLVRKAMIARDLSERGITRKCSAEMIARQANAAAGGPLMTPDELKTTSSSEGTYAVLDLNRANLSIAPFNIAINDAIEQRHGDTRRGATAALSRGQHRRHGMPAQGAV